jgi:hypothetical protein
MNLLKIWKWLNHWEQKQSIRTIRYPDADTNLLSDNLALQTRILDGYVVLAEKLYRVMAGPTDSDYGDGSNIYARFSSTQWLRNIDAGNRRGIQGRDPDNFSIEGFHNTMHAWLGGFSSGASRVNGTMTDNTYAAFDRKLRSSRGAKQA